MTPGLCYYWEGAREGCDITIVWDERKKMLLKEAVLLLPHAAPPSLSGIILFYRNISRTSAVTSTNFGSINIFAS